jgi:hypothetical protein
MNSERVFIGNIRKCTKYDMISTFKSETLIDGQPITSDSFGHIEKEDSLYKEGAILIKTNNGGYIDLTNVKSIDEVLLPIMSKKSSFTTNSRIMTTHPFAKGQLFVDEETLRPYFIRGNISIVQLKKQYKNK